MTRVVLATTNADKVTEIREILTGVDLVARPQEVPDVDEVGDTLEANARLKAQALVDATGMDALADDTGLEVEALNGAPGVRSARYAGEQASYAQNVDKLLDALVNVAPERRAARFRTVAVLLRADGSEVLAEGEVRGHITDKPIGAGWGYDPIFRPDDGDGRTFAEMSTSEKNAISHRGRAFRNLRASLGT